MKNNWKQKFDKLVEFNHGNGDILLRTEVFYDKEELKDFITSLLEEQKKEMMEQVKEIDLDYIYGGLQNNIEGFPTQITEKAINQTKEAVIEIINHHE